MKKTVMAFAIALCVFGAASVAHAQYYNPSYSWNYQVYPGGGYYSYSVSNGYETVSVYRSAGYGSAYYSYSYNGPYGSYSWYRNTSYPVYYPTYQYYPTYYGYPLYQARVQYPIRWR